MQALSIAAKRTNVTARRSQRRSLVLPGRVTWKDSRGTTRFASVMTRNVSDTGVFIEWSESTSIPLYRLVTFQLERDARNTDGLPPALRIGQSALGRLSRRRRSRSRRARRKATDCGCWWSRRWLRRRSAERVEATAYDSRLV